MTFAKYSMKIYVLAVSSVNFSVATYQCLKIIKRPTPVRLQLKVLQFWVKVIIVVTVIIKCKLYAKTDTETYWFEISLL